MKIKIILFSSTGKICGFKQKEIEFNDNAKVIDVKNFLEKHYPGIQKLKDNLLFALNETYCDTETLLADGDTLAVFPPVSGG